MGVWGERVGKKGGIGEGAKGACGRVGVWRVGVSAEGRIGVFERGTQLGIVRRLMGLHLDKMMARF